MQDLIKTERRSVRNISIDKPRMVSEETLPEEPETSMNQSSSSFEQQPRQPRPPLGNINRARGSMPRSWWIGGGVLLVIILIVVIGSIFSGATVTITPRQTPVNIDETFVAHATAGSSDIAFERVSVSRESTQAVQATGSETIERPASGTIVVYNDFGPEPQKLIVNTRFQTPEGLVYRIQESVTIPAKNADGTPGSVEAKVFADGVGEQYNIGLSDFTIPGFKEGGDLERFEKFYARSKTPMAGGFSGTVPVASEADTEAAELALEATLTEALTADLTQNLPDGYLIVDNSTTYSFETLPNTEGPDGTVVITVSGEAQGVAIDSRAMAREAATNRIQGYTGEPVAFVDPSTISVSLVDTAIDIGSATSTSLRASGASTLVWTFDIEELKEKIAGIKRSATRDIFSGYPGIERADVVVRPFWKRSLPKTIEDIEIRVESATN